MIPQPVSPATFHCTICEEPSVRICVYCTKDTCDNHICEKCLRCSDCCTCEVPLDANLNGHAASVATVVEPLVVEEELVVAVETIAEPEALAEPAPEALPEPEPEREREPEAPHTPGEPEPAA